MPDSEAEWNLDPPPQHAQLSVAGAFDHYTGFNFTFSALKSASMNKYIRM